MPNPTRLLRRRPHIDEAEVEAARSITLARLTAIFEDGTTPAEDTAPAEDGAPTDEAAPVEDPIAAAEAALTVEDTAYVEATVPAEATAPVEDTAPVAVSTPAEEPEPVQEAPPAVDAGMAAMPEAPATPTEAVAAEQEVGVKAGVHRNGHRAPGAILATTSILTIDDDVRTNGLATVDPDPDRPTAETLSAPVPADDAPISIDPDGWDLSAADLGEVAGRFPSEASMVRDDPSDSPSSPPIRRPRVTRPAAPRPRPTAPVRLTVPPRANPPTAGAVAVIASCPYCAFLLEPPPEADRRCARCRQRIIVKRVQGRAVYLTEAAVQVFDAERRRLSNTSRWTLDRGRWLKLAGSVGANSARIDRLERAVLSDEVVAAARALYESTVERLVRAAKREHRWDDAARLRRDQALSLYRMAGSPIPPPDDLVALHREAALAALRGIGEIAREAALVGADCCDPCRADDGRHFRISRELREPRLPHVGCPKGLCRCWWDLTVRDRNLVGGYLRRRARPHRVAPPAQPG